MLGTFPKKIFYWSKKSAGLEEPPNLEHTFSWQILHQKALNLNMKRQDLRSGQSAILKCHANFFLEEQMQTF